MQTGSLNPERSMSAGVGTHMRIADKLWDIKLLFYQLHRLKGLKKKSQGPPRMKRLLGREHPPHIKLKPEGVTPSALEIKPLFRRGEQESGLS